MRFQLTLCVNAVHITSHPQIGFPTIPNFFLQHQRLSSILILNVPKSNAQQTVVNHSRQLGMHGRAT